MPTSTLQPKRVAERLVKTLLGSPLYLGRETRVLGRAAAPAEAERPPRARVVILGKDRCHETVRRFPTGNTQEVRAAVELDVLEYSPFATDLFFLRGLGPRNETGADFALWFVRPDAARTARAARPWLVIPETVLFGQALGPGSYRIRRETDVLLLHVGANRETVSQLISSEVTTDLNGHGLPEPELFRRSLGRQAPVLRDIPIPDGYGALLARTWADAPLAGLGPFHSLGRPETLPAPRALARALIPVGVLVAVYLALWAGLSWQVQRDLDLRNEALNTELGSILDLQAGLERDRSLAAELARPLVDYAPRTGLLDLLARTLPAEVLLTGLNVTGPVVQISGRAPQASAVIAALNAAQGVSEVRFASPVRTDNRTGLEQFVIGFTLFRPDAGPEPA